MSKTTDQKCEGIAELMSRWFMDLCDGLDDRTQRELQEMLREPLPELRRILEARDAQREAEIRHDEVSRAVEVAKNHSTDSGHAALVNVLATRREDLKGKKVDALLAKEAGIDPARIATGDLSDEDFKKLRAAMGRLQQPSSSRPSPSGRLRWLANNSDGSSYRSTIRKSA